jgi:hypothetical protein
MEVTRKPNTGQATGAVQTNEEELVNEDSRNLSRERESR